MVARDLGTKRVTSPTPKRENPDYNAKDGSPKFLPDEPHIGATNHAEPKPKVVQTGYSRGGTTNPVEGESGDVEIVEFDTDEDVDTDDGEVVEA